MVISGPAGSGKGTVIKRLLEKTGGFEYSVSATTRSPRPGEVDGVNYFFLSREEFEKRIENDDMLEYANYCQNYYGTPKKEAFAVLESGKNLILEIEVKGAKQIKEKFPDAVTVLVVPPSYRVLEARLRGRGTETDEVIVERLNTSRQELENFNKYDYVIVNEEGQIEKAVDSIIEVSRVEQLKTSRNEGFAKRFFGETL